MSGATLHPTEGPEDMSEFDNAHAFVDGFFTALATRVPQSASLKSSHDVVESCLRLGQSISQEQNPNRAANITLASVALAASIINHINVEEGDCSIIKHDSGRISMIDICCGNLKKDRESPVKKAFSEGQEGLGIKGNFNQKEHPVNPLEWISRILSGRIFRFILTHPDMDHMDGIKALFNSPYKPLNFWDTDKDKELDVKSTFGKYSEDDWKFYKGLHSKTIDGVTFLSLHSGAKGAFYNQDDD